MSGPGATTWPWTSGSRSVSRLALSVGALLALGGCTTVGYLYQAGKGQLELSNRARPLAEVLHDETTPVHNRKLLTEIPRIKAFGERFGLKPTRNYESYVKLKRPAVVWVVSASDRLEFKPKEWGFPIVGSFTYLGWFSRDGAKKYASEVRKDQGLDVDVRGATAYSTLGWFQDPVLSTMILPGDEGLGALVNVILHESAHATLYVSGQSYFNESLASFVGDQLAPVYLKEFLGDSSPEARAYLAYASEEKHEGQLLQEAYYRLEQLYASDKPKDRKLAEKAAIFAKLKEDVHAKRDLNNATLIQFKTYGVGDAEFQALFRACGKDWKRFWAVLGQLAPDHFPKEQQEDLAPLLLGMAKGGCRAPALP